MNTHYVPSIGYQHWNGDGNGDGHDYNPYACGDGCGIDLQVADTDPYTLNGDDVLPSGDGVGTGPAWKVKCQRPGDGSHVEVQQ